MDQIRAYLTQKREQLRGYTVHGPWTSAFFEFVSFGVKQAWACIFGGALLALILATHLWWPETSPIARADFLVIAAVIIQAVLLLTKLETWEEARVIVVFHLVGTAMEIFKTSLGSWAYEGGGILQIGGVPLYSGFMYAAIGSYLARVWRIFEFEFIRFPPLWLQALLAGAIYANFFAHHYVIDARNILFAASVLIYGPCIVKFRPDKTYRSMPLVIGFGLVAIFIWIAENIGTYARAWTYPGQAAEWALVSYHKLGAWYLLMIISFVLVAAVHSPKRSSARGLLPQTRE